MEFPRQEDWSGSHFLLQESNLGLLHCQETTEPPGKPIYFGLGFANLNLGELFSLPYPH